MKKSTFAFRFFSLAMTLVLISGMFGLSALAADESDYVAEFRIETDKSTAKKDEEITVSVFLKADYYICTMSVVAVYDGEKLTMQNTSDTNLKGYLTFTGSMADSYYTNGNWQSPEQFYTKRNSNVDFWSSEEAMSKYKFAYATWSADTSISYELVKLSEEEKIMSFVLKANEDIEDMSELVFISNDFQKTNENKQGLLFVGRSASEEFSAANMIPFGQTIVYNGKDPTKCEHSYGDWEEAVAPTCKETGLQTKTCMLCGDTVTEELPVSGHTESEFVVENEVAPDCVTDGSYDEVIYCEVCGEELSCKTITVPATGHNYKAEVTAPTCEDRGYTTYTCTCSDSYVADYTDALGHTPGKVVIVDATTGKEGTKTTHCAVCDKVISVEIIEKIEGEENIPSIVPAEGTNTVIDKENNLIYGLEEGINSLDSFVEVKGYSLEYTYFNDSFGTGTRVDCVLNGEVKETYYIVIFGDVTGDAVIDIYDVSAFAAVVNGDIELNDVFSFAADVFADEAVDSYDYMVAASVVNGDIVLSQNKE